MDSETRRSLFVSVASYIVHIRNTDIPRLASFGSLASTHGGARSFAAGSLAARRCGAVLRNGPYHGRVLRVCLLCVRARPLRPSCTQPSGVTACCLGVRASLVDPTEPGSSSCSPRTYIPSNTHIPAGFSPRLVFYAGDQGGVRLLRLRPAPGLLRVRHPQAPLPVRGDPLHLRQDGEAEDPLARAGGPGAPHPAVFAVDSPPGPAGGTQRSASSNQPCVLVIEGAS